MTLDEEEIRRLYWDEGKTLAEVAEMVYCSENTLHHFMVEHDIPRRRKGNRNIKKHKVNGEMLTVNEISQKYGISPSTIQGRIRKGQKDLLNERERAKRHEVRGRMLTVREIAKKYHCNEQVIYKKLRNGMTGEDLIRRKKRSKAWLFS